MARACADAIAPAPISPWGEPLWDEGLGGTAARARRDGARFGADDGIVTTVSLHEMDYTVWVFTRNWTRGVEIGGCRSRRRRRRRDFVVEERHGGGERALERVRNLGHLGHGEGGHRRRGESGGG